VQVGRIADLRRIVPCPGRNRSAVVTHRASVSPELTDRD
jgi:hypothetical protein